MWYADDMNPKYGVISWIIIGALAGWIGSKIVGTDAIQGGWANIVTGVVGGLVGGKLTTFFFRDDKTNNGFLTSLATAVVGACVVIFAWMKIRGM